MLSIRSKLIIGGVATALLFIGVGVGLMIVANEYIVKSCKDDSSAFQRFIVNILKSVVTIPSITYAVSTAGFPSEILFNQTVQTQYGPIYINTSIPLNLPPFVLGATGKNNISIDSIIPNTTILQSSRVINDLCGYLTIAVDIFGSIITFIFVWLILLSFFIAVAIDAKKNSLV